MNVTELTKRIFFIDIFMGLALTLKTFFSPPITRQYPEEPRLPAPGFRGLHALVRKEDGTPRCVGCGCCAAVCPSQCIHVYTADGPDHEKIVERYEIEVVRCLFCGLCVEACPFQAIALTPHFEYADFTRKVFFMDKEKLLGNFDSYMGGEKTDEYFMLFRNPKVTGHISSEDLAPFSNDEKRNQ
ncbi:MAG TPA: NADH-quinone oxidoreductase subunit I [Dissulfurispiraceae bacterium]|nr:NADH-quinone oxidoreductase subunit I [Dissulfurispiraceae bacterium]